MDFLVIISRISLLFIEVFCVFITLLLMVGAVMETTYAGIGSVMAIVGLIYAYIQREKEDLIDRYFYYIIGVIITYAIALFTS